MTSLELAREEVHDLVRRPIMVAAFVVMMVIPLLYGVLYLWAFWDPYGALGKVPVALVNLDRPAQADEETIAAGSDLAAELIDKGTFEWHVVSAEEAARGVREGTYYSSFTIPSDFSTTLAAADSDHPKTARLLVVKHESRNMIAGQIEDKVFSEVRKAASASASRGYYESIFLGFTDLREGLTSAADGSSRLATGVADAEDGARRVADGSDEARNGALELEEGLGLLASGAGRLADGAAAASAGTDELLDGATALDGGASSLAEGAGRVAQGTSGLASGMGALSTGATSLSVSARTLTQGAAKIDSSVADAAAGITEAADSASSLGTGATAVRQLLDALAAKYPETAADPLFVQARGTAGSVASGTVQLAAALGAASSDASALSAGTHRLWGGANQLAEGASALSSATLQAWRGAGVLSGGASEIASGSAALFGGTRKLAAGADRLAAGATELSSGSRTLAEELATAHEGSTGLASGLGDLASGTSDLADGLSLAVSGSRELANGLTAGVQDVPDLDEEQRDARAQMMSDPVGLETTDVGDVDTYGTGFAPYFVPLSLWVGMLIVFVLLSPIPARAARSGAKPSVIAMTGMWPAIIIALGQSVLLYTVLRVSLDFMPVRPLATFALMLLTAVVFAAIMQWLGAAFGPVGKLMGIVILMLQLTSAAGTFPLETLPGFFRAISPWMPMTHAVAALREAVSGGDMAACAREAWQLALFGVASFVGTVVTARSAHRWSEKRLRPTLSL